MDYGICFNEIGPGLKPPKMKLRNRVCCCICDHRMDMLSAYRPHNLVPNTRKYLSGSAVVMRPADLFYGHIMYR